MTTTMKPLPTKGMSPFNRTFGKSYPTNHPRQKWWSDNTIVLLQGAVVAIEMGIVLIILNNYFSNRAALAHAHAHLPATPNAQLIMILLFGIALTVPVLTLIKRGIQLAWWHIRH